jgi:alpha,alpha-trehalase
VVEGLTNYGYPDAARRVMQKWCDNNAAVFEATGYMWEKYNVVMIGAREEGGLYGSVPGFGWSNAIFKVFANRLGAGRN